MKPIALQPSLVTQAYEAILNGICDGSIAANTHLVQEVLAARLGVSRQPVQQALLLLRQEGVVRDAGRRGLIVAPLDLPMMRHRYQVRSVLDALAAGLAAERCAASPALASAIGEVGGGIVAAGEAAVAAGGIGDMIARDVEFHAFLYDASGNPVLEPTAQIHWRYFKRVMGEVLRHAGPPHAIWHQHRAILTAVLAGDAAAASERALQHVDRAAERLGLALARKDSHAREEARA